MNAMTRLRIFITGHLAISALAAVSFAWLSDHNWRDAVTHTLLVGEWDFLLVVALGGWSPTLRWPRFLFNPLMVVTLTLQGLLYALNLVSNLSWSRNITAHLVVAFTPTVWSGE